MQITYYHYSDKHLLVNINAESFVSGRVYIIRQINLGLTPLQVSGSTSAGRVVCGTDLAGCVSVPGDFLRPQAFIPFLGGLDSLPGAWGAPNKGNADGAEGIFGKLRARVGYGPAPGPTPKKALCHSCP